MTKHTNITKSSVKKGQEHTWPDYSSKDLNGISVKRTSLNRTQERLKNLILYGVNQDQALEYFREQWGWTEYGTLETFKSYGVDFPK